MTVKIFTAFQILKAIQLNDSYSFIAGNRIVGFDPSDGSAKLEFDIGDLTVIATGSLAGDWLARSGKSLKVHNAAGAEIGSVSYDDLLNLQSASETQEGTAEIATQAEVDAGTDDLRIVTPAKLLGLYNASTRAATLNGRLPVNDGGAFDEIIIKSGTITHDGAPTSQSFNFAQAFPNGVSSVVITSKRGTLGTQSPNITAATTSNFTVLNVDSSDIFFIATGF